MSNISVWNSERIIHSGEEYFDGLAEDIRRAVKFIDLEVYIFEHDELGKKFAALLCEAARRGVQVRVMVDGVGSPGFYGYYGKLLIEAGVQFKIYNPIPWDISLFSWRLFPGISRIIQFFWSANRRNHRKAIIVDHKAVWTGGINIAARQSPKYYGSKAWRDTGIRVEGPETSEFMRAFEAAWAHAWSPVPVKRDFQYFWRSYRTARRRQGFQLVHFNFTRWLRRRMNRELFRRIVTAQEKIWITTAYFVPDRNLIRAIRQAARKPVDIRIIVPSKSDVFFTPWLSGAFYYKLIKAGVKIYEYAPTMIHAKTVLIDSWGLVGTANLNHRSLKHDLEVNVVVSTEEGIQSLTNQFLKDQDNSRLITIEDWKKRPAFVRMVGQMLLRLRHWF